MKCSMLLITAVALTLSASCAQGNDDELDLAAAKTTYKSVCKNCHGPTAAGMASFPKLAGRDADYITSRLKRYRAGEEVGPNSPLMIPHAKKLSDSDIAGLAAYISETFQ